MRIARPLLCCAVLFAASLSAGEERVVFRGSVAVKPIVDACAKAFAAANPGVTVGGAGCTSDLSIQAVVSGEAQLGALVKDLTPEQRAAHPDLRTIPVALDGLVLVVNGANPIPGLTKAQVVGVFSGAIASWKEVGGADAIIVPVVRMKTFASSAFFGASFGLEYQETGEGAAKRMQHRAVGAADWGPAPALITDDHPKGLAKVVTTAEAITYAPYGIARGMASKGAAIRLLALDGIEPTPAAIQSGAYPVTRPCLLLVKGEPQGALKAFIDFMASAAGQQVVEAADFVPLAR
jgi:phosphate transport system substrate-binding protein